MARHLDLEEQEQLDQLKHFWNQYGNLITWLLIIALGAFAAWNGWQYWERKQAFEASALVDELEKVANAGDVERVERVFGDVKDKYGSTTYAQQAALVAARVLAEKGKPDAARAALAWLAEKGGDPGYQAIGKLRLAGLAADQKAYDEALKQLEGEFPTQFQALVADRRGDVYNLQGKKEEAKAEYTKALKAAGGLGEYANLVEVKLTALGVDVKTLLPTPAEAAASAGAKP